MMANSMEYFTQVSFSEVQETYESQSDLVCKLTISSSVPHDGNSHVGIFPVGWKSVKDYFASKMVKFPADNNADGDVITSVTFSADSLPHNDNEFYQFCFVSGSDQRVRGASSPFQFTNEQPVDWEIVDRKDSLFGIQQEPPADTEIVQKLSEEDSKKNLTESSELLESCSQWRANAERLQQELSNSQQELARKTEEYSSSLNALQVALDDSRKQCSNKDLEIQQLKLTLEELQNKEALNQQELDKYHTTVDSLNEQLDESNKQCRENVCEVEQLKLALEKYRKNELECKQQLSSLRSQLNTYQPVEKATTESEAAADVVDSSQQETQEDNEDESYHDAQDGEPVKKCPICDWIFPADTPQEIVASHIENHVVKICPVCTLEFSPEDHEKFEQHVYICLKVSNEVQQHQPQQLGSPLDITFD